MSSWIKCPCGELLHTNLFAGAPVFRLIRDADYDAVSEPVDGDKLANLFFDKGIPVFKCGKCGRMAVEWGNNEYSFYRPEELRQPAAVSPGDDCRLKELEALAEEEYAAMYESVSPVGHYASARDAFSDAIALAEKMGRTEDVQRLTARRDEMKKIFRHQFV